MLRHTFRAMGTDIECLLERPHDAVAERALAGAEAEFARLEATLSRFLPDSELSLLNAAGEATVGADLLELVEAAVEARERHRRDASTRPSTTRWSRRATTARSSSSTCRHHVPTADTALPPHPRPARCGGEVHIDRQHSRVTLDARDTPRPRRHRKGHAADRVSGLLGTAGPCLVSAGGDIAVRGSRARVSGRSPCRPETARSRSASRTADSRPRASIAAAGSAAGVECHHIIDPATRAPGRHGSAARHRRGGVGPRRPRRVATSLLLAGDLDAAVREADAAGTPSVLVGRDGRTRLAGGLR